VVTVDPSGELLCPKATRDRARSCCPRSRMAPLLAPPLEITAPTRELVKVRQSCPPQSHSRLAFARPDIANGSARVKDPVPPTGQIFHCEFSMFSIFLLILAN